ncbi:hypothetical protein [Micromonospora costi]|uniref:Uncharacterized protein n=1 Tax=Micromonospora costi TaxID=1530042 RepID=A0A3B0A699_9ACTN|nr:hypothetical protein [Micromonospora costi]RKN55919.1 hypothetical protein D7193_15130 [Micromonospora costi]
MGSFERTRQARREVADGAAVGMSAGWRIGIAVLVVLAVGAAIAIGSWYFRVATSGVKGAGDATRITNDGQNRVNAQEWFAGMYQEIRSTDRRIDEAYAEVSRKPTEINQENYRGLVNRCIDMVGDYNAEAQKVSRGQWRDPSLPAQIDDTDPTTDCRAAHSPDPATTR